ncbi:MAG: T9SS type A sorting domain-containing protein [Chryseobacterium jejuense]|uniref:T9SS type A sorting domain-containing protein n=1 Tax=Chryseobacterium jejuense TaxID=445960 RepID=UPI003D0BF76C
MRKINFTLIVCTFLCFYGKAQIALAKEDGAPINNGQIITYNTTNEHPANLHYKIKNTSSSPINFRIKVSDIKNADGSSFQFCYLNICLPFISSGAVYPPNSKPAITIPGNSELSAGYTMWNSDTGTGNFPIDYELKYYMVDDFNNEFGTPVTFTYRYDPNAVLKVEDVKAGTKPFAEISSTVVKDNIHVTSKENVSYIVYNMEGRSVLEGKLKKERDQIGSATLSPGAYMILFKNDKGKTIAKKIIKSN